ncbi:MAG: 4-(cytidine 5'-diphospho)-2-C-methyl-D-erythritol kinase [Bacteroidales bacterium]|nr:4-(cytidine 5'-diphospho)-2-C-methyl-D-erythritol kinase [Bacteroidales bacterium]
MVIFPFSKINIGLVIKGKRPDGYHDIETIFYPVGFCDALEIAIAGGKATEDILTVTGLQPCGKNEENIVLRAVRKLRERVSFPFLKIHLHKVIPSGAGLGGGSSDAAGILKIVNKCFRLSISTDELKEIGLTLGSDVPFFIDGQPAHGSGRGEILKPLKKFLEGYHIVLVNPGIFISTSEAYSYCSRYITEKKLSDPSEIPVEEWKDSVFNDFEAFVFSKYPETEEIKKEFYQSGALFSSLSGSGSTFYGIFHDKPSLSSVLKQKVIYSGLL